MVRKTKKELYAGVSIPISLMNHIEQIIKENPEMTYRSRAEFIMESIREKMERIDLIQRQDKILKMLEEKNILCKKEH
jgi:metal-responsive CopG/Arc/MetJ family transcriptional regulator